MSGLLGVVDRQIGSGRKLSVKWQKKVFGRKVLECNRNLICILGLCNGFLGGFFGRQKKFTTCQWVSVK